MPETYLDHINTPLNACSLEALPEPVVKKYQIVNGHRQASIAWPVLVGCYELDQDSGKRNGCLALHLVDHLPNPTVTPVVGDVNKRIPMSSSVSFGDPTLALPWLNKNEEENLSTLNFSGILDGKWSPKYDKTRVAWWFATACASGEIRMYELNVQDQNEEMPCQLRQVGSSSNNDDDEEEALCLAVNWDTTATAESTFAEMSTRSIVSSYSNGQVAVHDVAFPSSSTSQGQESSSNNKVKFEEKYRWDAHTLFGKTPTEVWTACFANNNHNSEDGGRVVLSGGDDGKCKIWDVRSSTFRPIHTITNFDAGVTVVSTHPRKDHVVAIGSYDESVSIYDVRSPTEPLSTLSMGGGIWRIQWHPIDNNRMLVAAMHGGCRVVQLDDGNAWKMNIEKEFTEHTSMAYGADWLVCQHDGDEGSYYEAAASCSFYDRATYLWNTIE